MTTTPTPDPFAALDAQHAGEDRFTRNPQNRPEIEPARTSAANFSIEVGPVSVDEIGPASSRQYEIGLWDNEEGAFLHGMMLPDREAAEALHRALDRLLFG